MDQQQNIPGSDSQEMRRTKESAQRTPSEDKNRAASAKPRRTPEDAQSAPKASTNGSKKRTASAKKPKTGDSGYVPHQAAKQKRRKADKKAFRSFFSGKPAKAGMADDPAFALNKAKKKKAPPAIVYTEPKAFSRSRFLVQILSVFAVVVALVLAMSVFFRVDEDKIMVSGTQAYSPYTVRQASGISAGDNLLTFGRARAAGQILANLPYVRNVRIGIKLPDTVKIEIEEEDVVYAISDTDSGWWLMNSDGKIVAQTNLSGANKYTKVLGVELAEPTAGAIAVAQESFYVGDEAQDNPNVITGAAKLDAALDILQQLEKNDVMGDVASVDVTRLDDIVLWYGTQYQVNLGDNGNTEYKIACMVDVILQMSDYQNGILDVSFITWPDQVGFTPFG